MENNMKMSTFSSMESPHFDLPRWKRHSSYQFSNLWIRFMTEIARELDCSVARSNSLKVQRHVVNMFKYA